MKRVMSRIITIYTLCWIAVLVFIVSTQKEITLYYAAISVFFIGLIILLGLIVIKKTVNLRYQKNKTVGYQEMLGVIISTVLFIGLTLFVVIYTLRY